MDAPTNGMRPIHPGEVLREEFLLPMGLSAHALSMAMHVPAPRINDIVRERRGVTADTAMRLARYFSTNAERYRVLNLNPRRLLALGPTRRRGAGRLAGCRSVAVEDVLQGGLIEDAIGPDVELVQGCGLEARVGLLVERTEAFG